MGFKITNIHEIILGTYTDKKGIYRCFGKEENDLGEIYTRGSLEMNDNISVIIEAGKNAYLNDGKIELIDAKNNRLLWEMFPLNRLNERLPGSRLTMYGYNGKIVATCSLQIDCYLLIMEEIYLFAALKNSTPYLEEHVEIISNIEKFHLVPRSKISNNQMIAQLSVSDTDYQKNENNHLLNNGTTFNISIKELVYSKL